jgi:hypothetical protein
LEVADFVLFRPNFLPSDGGCDYVYDPSIIHPNGADQLSFLHNPSRGFKAVTSTKNAKYKAACAQLGRKFFPLPAYTYGNIGPAFQDLASHLALKISTHMLWPHSVAANHVSSSITTTLARANSNLLLSRFFHVEASRRDAFQNPRLANLAPFTGSDTLMHVAPTYLPLFPSASVDFCSVVDTSPASAVQMEDNLSLS